MDRKLLQLAGFLAAFVVLACEKKQPGSERPSNTEIAGQWLYENDCAECHENPQPDLHKQPPNLHGLFRRGSLPSGAPATAAQIRTTIIAGRGTMPAFDQRLREEDVNNLVRYLRKLN
jgi:mono/diheme cytochrome c family protein